MFLCSNIINNMDAMKIVKIMSNIAFHEIAYEINDFGESKFWRTDNPLTIVGSEYW